MRTPLSPDRPDGDDPAGIGFAIGRHLFLLATLRHGGAGFPLTPRYGWMLVIPLLLVAVFLAHQRHTILGGGDADLLQWFNGLVLFTAVIAWLAWRLLGSNPLGIGCAYLLISIFADTLAIGGGHFADIEVLISVYELMMIGALFLNAYLARRSLDETRI